MDQNGNRQVNSQEWLVKLTRSKKVQDAGRGIFSSVGLQALALLTRLDIPAKGRIAHHIRTGRIAQALNLCAGAQLYLWRKIWSGAGNSLLEQVNALGQLEAMLRGESANIKEQFLQGGLA